MTQLVQTQIRYSFKVIAGVAIAASLLGGAVGGGVQALLNAAPAAAPTMSAHDLAVLKAAQEWEARYRQQYPHSR